MMGTTATLTVDKFSVSVEQTPDSLTYSISPRGQPKVTPLAVACVVLVPLGYPLATLAVVVYALILGGADRPAWELALTGLFALQLAAWLVRMAGVIRGMISSPGSTPVAVLTFTGGGVSYGGEQVCELADVRGLRLFVYPLRGDPPGKLRAALSLAVGEERGTHGLLGRLDAADLRALAEDMQRRLAALRWDQGLMPALDPLSVVETTRESTAKLMSTRPPAARTLRGRVGRAVARHPLWAATAWGLVVLAGTFGSGRLVLAAGLRPGVLVGHVAVVFIYLLLLAQWVKARR
jgi:hypothetical protein